MISLEGVRILAVDQYGAGPWGSLHLADMGAEVIKIEDPSVGGDISRSVPPYVRDGDSLFFQTFNRNKYGITLNLNSEEGRGVFHRLVAKADAVYSNLRGDLPARFGLTYDDLSPINPKIVCCHLTGYGRGGQRASEPAYDYLIQAETGLMSLTGEPDGPPERCGLSVIDFMGGVTAAFAVTAGILSVRLNGRGGDVDVNLLDVGTSLLNYLATWHLTEGFVPERMADSAHPTLVPSQAFPTADGYIVIMCNKEKFWVELCNVIGAPDLRDDERFQDFEGRRTHRSEVITRLKEYLVRRTTTEWLDVMRGRVPASPVNSVSSALENTARQSPGMIASFSHPVWGNVRQLATPVAASGRDNAPVRPAPTIGQDTQEVLERLAGISENEFERLRDAGAV